jgi:hypothetical protein
MSRHINGASVCQGDCGPEFCQSILARVDATRPTLTPCTPDGENGDAGGGGHQRVAEGLAGSESATATAISRRRQFQEHGMAVLDDHVEELTLAYPRKNRPVPAAAFSELT